MISDSHDQTSSDPVECANDGDSFETTVARALTATGNCNTNKKAEKIRQVLESPKASKLRHLAGLEDSWRRLKLVYEDRYYVEGEGNPAVVRKIDTAETPITDFTNCVAQGFYPPPEIMIILQICFEKYLTASGDISLDEAFFGVPHRKRNSYANGLNDGGKYALFHELVKADKKGAGKSVGHEELIKDYLASPFARIWGDAGTDNSTFLTGYFRWKRNRIEDS